MLHEPFDANQCPKVSSLAEINPPLNDIMMRCTAGVTWTAVPIGADEKAVVEGYKSRQAMKINLDNFTCG